MPKSKSIFCAFFAVIFIITPAASWGYVGPACAVVDDRLFLHGAYVRRLAAEELSDFHRRQTAADVRRQLVAALKRGTASVDRRLLAAPPPPAFCDGLDDAVEVVLDECIVRDHKVYVSDQFIRLLDPLERIVIDALIQPTESAGRRRRRRRRRHEYSAASRPPLFVFGRRRLSPKRSLRTTARPEHEDQPSKSQDETWAQFQNDSPVMDPLLLNLLQSLAAQQQSVSQIVDANNLNNNNNNYAQQQQQQLYNNNYNNNNNQVVEAPAPTGLSRPNDVFASEPTPPMRVGDKILIGGRTYVAVPLASFATPSALFGGGVPAGGDDVMTLGLIPADVLRPAPQVQQYPSIAEKVIGQVQYGNGRGVLPTFDSSVEWTMPTSRPAAFLHYVPSDSAVNVSLRFSPESIQTVANPRLPHEICRNLNVDM